jgi:hypothetical protein
MNGRWSGEADANSRLAGVAEGDDGADADSFRSGVIVGTVTAGGAAAHACMRGIPEADRTGL